MTSTNIKYSVNVEQIFEQMVSIQHQKSTEENLRQQMYFSSEAAFYGVVGGSD